MLLDATVVLLEGAIGGVEVAAEAVHIKKKNTKNQKNTQKTHKKKKPTTGHITTQSALL